ncbi:MAG: solute:sodium symporter family transporter [Prolixibacteraceae bacterium]|jgi:solute:Na+ symporter, SSS family|nr:solute:sodium symporter family transporter [Prolixibacteraceae bacterium]MBT6004136.1 solute:sodium symporter family transporter [Prolixibacteraceae bacterium]MBT6998769.1 solute:sodium symporter family transporter [Prolixibacteraceae bacterium]MBT7393959.1 solute:sodium symporter family transporter [Prolixibacteraceae bacterium]
MLTVVTFIGFTAFVAFYAWFKLRKDKMNSSDDYFLGGRSLTGIVIAGSMLLTNISTEHLIGMNGSSYKNGFIIIGWEVTSALALVVAAIYFIPKYLRMGLTTIPEYLEKRFDGTTRSFIALFLVVSFVFTLLPIVLYTGAINLESIFNISEVLEVSKAQGLWITVVAIGVIGSFYAIFGGLKAVAVSDTINGYGLLIGGMLVPIIALLSIGDGNVMAGLTKVFEHAPEKFNVVGAKDSVMPFGVLFTGLIINQLYFWGMNQTIIQRALGAKNLKEAQKGLLFTGVLKILVPIIIVLPGVIGFYYFGDSMYENQDHIYPALIKKVLPLWMVGFFAAVVMGAVLSTFNSVLNSAATIFSIDVYKRHIKKDATEKRLVWIGRATSSILAIFAILSAPLVAGAPDGLYQLLQQLNGIFFIPVASIMLAGFFLKSISATGAKAALFFGLSFYIITTFILKVDIHFIHIWGIEFVLNMIIMFAVSYYYPRKTFTDKADAIKIDMKSWKYAKHLSIALVIITILIYILLGQN